MSSTRGFWALLLAALLFAVTAWAGDELLTPGEEVLRALREADDDDRDKIMLLREATQIFRYPASEKEAAALFAEAGKATRSKRSEVRVAAIRAVASMGAPKAASLIEPFLREKDPTPEERPALLMAIEAAGRLHDATLIPSLLALAKTGKDPTIADQALLALGAYHELTNRERKALVDKALALAKSMKRNRRRWRRMRAPALRCLQLLTGLKLNSVDLFAEWWKVAKDAKEPFGSE